MVSPGMLKCDITDCGIMKLYSNGCPSVNFDFPQLLAEDSNRRFGVRSLELRSGNGTFLRMAMAGSGRGMCDKELNLTHLAAPQVSEPKEETYIDQKTAKQQMEWGKENMWKVARRSINVRRLSLRVCDKG